MAYERTEGLGFTARTARKETSLKNPPIRSGDAARADAWPMVCDWSLLLSSQGYLPTPLRYLGFTGYMVPASCDGFYLMIVGTNMESNTNKKTNILDAKRKCEVVLTDYAKKGNVSDSESVASIMSVSSHESRTSKTGSRFWRKRHIQDTGDGFSSDAAGDETSPCPKARRGRGRPPSTGQYVGLAKAKAELNAAKAEELRLQAEEEMAAETRRNKEARAATFLKASSSARSMVDQDQEYPDLGKLVNDSVETIVKVAKSSGNLKGTYVRALKEAADTIKASFVELRARTITDEVARLEEANTRLSNQLEELRKEMLEMRQLPQQQQSSETPSLNVEEIVRTVMVQCGTMMSARLDGLESRLLPEKRLRPPLAADKRRETMENELTLTVSPSLVAPIPVPKMGPSKKVTEVTAPKPGNDDSALKTKRGKKNKRKGGSQTTPVREEARPAEPAVLPPSEGWVTVTRKKKSHNGTTTGPTPGLRQPQSQPPVKTKKKKRKPRLRPPRSAAVVVTLQPGATEKGASYGAALAQAKSNVDLAGLGITGLRFRTAVTGARIFEIPGSGSGDKADALAAKLREVLNPEDVRISRPTICAEMRISGLDDSVTTGEVIAAISQKGECPGEAVKATEIRRNYAGLGTTIVRCPVTAAKKVVNGGRLLVGWVSARVQLLSQRPLRCYHCLAEGHVHEKCTSEIDRSKLCYRCSKPGHKSAGCSAEPHCALCAASNRPAGHRIGSAACAPPSKKNGEKLAGNRPRPSNSTPSARVGAISMDIQ